MFSFKVNSQREKKSLGSWLELNKRRFAQKVKIKGYKVLEQLKS